MDGDEETDLEYFQAVEDIYLHLRGSGQAVPADYEVIQGWHRAGIPLDVVDRGLKTAFVKWNERGSYRGAKGRIPSLRYCAPAVEAAWAERRELTASGWRDVPPPLDEPTRLHRLAAALPEAFFAREDLAARITGLEGDPQSIEEELARLDGEMLATAAAALDPDMRAEIAAAVRNTLESLKGRLPPEELERSRERLTLQVLRQRLGLPMLSLFSPDAEREDGSPMRSDPP